MLWDVDGTLIDSAGIGAAVFDRALEKVLGTAPASRLHLSGKTDPQIVREYLELMAVDSADGRLGEVLSAVEAALAAAASDLAQRGRTLPGVPELLARLDSAPGVHQTVLTGNTAANAMVKLTTFGLERWLDLDIGAYGSDDPDRCRLVPVALDRARRRRGLDVSPDRTWVVGDTANDLVCARAGRARCLLVATGRTALEELECLEPDVVLADLTDTEAVVALLTAD
ncbi:MAG: haloacid dehalogenase-like hydrolase [Actinomycetota bacterium]|nr:haloacid dehalogenase-like hydrolase [Actinomycetota bacterium]